MPRRRIVHDTPDTPTIATLVDLLNARDDLRRDDREWTAADTLKNVVVKLRHPDGTVEPLAIGVPGDRDVDMKRLEAAVCPAEAEPFAEADFARYPALAKGYIGPGVLGDGERRRASASSSTRASSPAPAGSPAPTQPGRHVVGLVAGRDFTPDGVIDVAEVRAGDLSPDGEELEIARGIEIGHIFQLGRKYAEALGPHGAGPGRQAGHGDDGFLRHRRVARRRGDRRGDLRRPSACAGRARSPRPTSTS